MNKLYLFTLLLVLLQSIEQNYSAGINHDNQKSPASIIYADGPAPDELKAGPLNKNISERRQNAKTGLQRYIVTTGAPTIETVFESSSMTPNLKSSINDQFLAEKLNYDNINNHRNGYTSTGKLNHRNSRVKNGHYINSHFERYTNDESTKFHGYEVTTVAPESETVVPSSHDSSSSYIDTTSLQSSNYPTTTVYSVYNNPILVPGIHSTSFSNEHSSYNQNNHNGDDGSLGEVHSRKGFSNSNNHHNYDKIENAGNNFNTNFADPPKQLQYQSQLSISGSNISPDNIIRTGIIESEISLPTSTDSKQTHHIVHHQPVPVHNQTDPDVVLQRFTYGDRINTPEHLYVPHPTPTPVYNRSS